MKDTFLIQNEQTIMYKNSINNQCFEPSTLLQYRTELNGQIFTKSIADVYAQQQENPDMIIYVPVVFGMSEKDSEDSRMYSGMVTWKEARLCETQSSQCVTVIVDVKRDMHHAELEHGRIRVTPNHVFVVEKDGHLKEEAYLLTTNEKILFDAYKVYGDEESPMFISEDSDEIATEDLLSEGSEHTVVAVTVKRCSVMNNYNNKKPWAFYGIILTDSTDKCVLMPTGLISHDSSVTY